ncbi:hypothetical protein Taro_012873 [Colocasia esculenta]|uniref:Uncharacterized protein n=1 Tax=Colocasia esculenta TaxID=4460 RepID=A0A843UA15_COLES|nr:hypothetical protein [Colocasia esculenta]
MVHGVTCSFYTLYGDPTAIKELKHQQTREGVTTVLPVATAIQVATGGRVAFSVCRLSEWQAWQGDLSGCRGAQGGHVLVAESFPLRRSGGSGLAERRRFVRSGGASPWERGGGGKLFVKDPLVVAFVGNHGMWIPPVDLPADVATAERVATSEEVSPRSDATLSRRGRAVCADVGRWPFWRLFPEGVLCVPVPAGLPRVPVSEGVAPGGGRAQVSDLEQKGKTVGQQREPEEGEEEGEEGEEFVAAAVLIQKEIQPKLGAIVIQRFGAVVLWFGALVLWSRCAHVLLLPHVFDSAVSEGVVFGLTRFLMLWLVLPGFSLLALVEVRFPQSCVVIVSGCCGVALWVEVHRLAAVFWWCFPELFVVVLLVAIALPSRLRTVLACFCQLLCYLRVEDREVGFISRTLWALPDGGLVSAMGVWLVVLLWKCHSRLLWRVLLVIRVVSAVGATVLHLAKFWCLWWHHVLVPEWFVFVLSGTLVHCVALWVAPGVEFSASGTLRAGRALWLYRYRCGVAALPCLVADVLSCLALPTSDVFLGFVSARLRGFRLAVSVVLVGLVRVAPEELSTSVCVLCAIVVRPVSCRMSGLALPCGRVMVVTTGKSRCDLVVPWHLLLFSDRCRDGAARRDSHPGRDRWSRRILVAPGQRVATRVSLFGLLEGVCHLSEWQAWQGDLSGCRGAQSGRVLVAVWAAVAIQLVSRHPTPSRSGGYRLKALAERRRFVRRGGASPWERGGGGKLFVKAPLGFVVAFVGDHGIWMPSVGLPADVATAERVSTSEEASPRFNATLSRHGWPS